MGARIVRLPLASPAAERRLPQAETAAHRFMFWHGASGRRYVHTVYTLLDCPELPSANYILVRCAGDGRRQVLRIGHVGEAAPSLNLAQIRRLGAGLGANEVHVHLLAGDADEGRVVELDLRAGQFESLAAEPAARTLH